jgi:hypothetical protein
MFPIEQTKPPRETVIRVKTENFINKAACKKFLMDYAKGNRYHSFTCFDSGIYDELNGLLRRYMQGIVKRQPSSGRTLRSNR